jgi:uncharacterized membrane protein YeaQ/YmgE (transglycosylase-associated protein family)
MRTLRSSCMITEGTTRSAECPERAQLVPNRMLAWPAGHASQPPGGPPGVSTRAFSEPSKRGGLIGQIVCDSHVNGGNLVGSVVLWKDELYRSCGRVKVVRETLGEISMEHGIIAWLVIGAVAGWLAGKVVEGSGFGLIVDIIVGIVGAFIGGWLAGALGISIGGGFIGSIIVAVIGAVILLFVLRFIKRAV